jgi:DNA-binding transcriptional LysR family regulator
MRLFWGNYGRAIVFYLLPFWDQLLSCELHLMELRHLRYFVAVAEEENLRRAASRLHVAAPPLSVQIRQLEREIGTDLFIRQKRSIRLTDAGRVFLEQARKSLAEAKRGVSMARQAAAGEIGQLAIGHNAPSGFRVFPQILGEFRQRWPEIHLTFHHANNIELLERLRRGEFDLGFGWLPVPADEFDAHALLDEPLTAVLPQKHRLASQRSLSIGDLSGEPLILAYRALDPEAYHAIEQLFLRVGAVMNPVCELDNSLSMINFVAMGIGCSLLPGYARGIRQDGVVYRPLDPPNLVRTLAIIKKRGGGKLVERFFDFTISCLPYRNSAAEDFIENRAVRSTKRSASKSRKTRAGPMIER